MLNGSRKIELWWNGSRWLCICAGCIKHDDGLFLLVVVAIMELSGARVSTCSFPEQGRDPALVALMDLADRVYKSPHVCSQETLPSNKITHLQQHQAFFLTPRTQIFRILLFSLHRPETIPKPSTRETRRSHAPQATRQNRNANGHLHPTRTPFAWIHKAGCTTGV